MQGNEQVPAPANFAQRKVWCFQLTLRVDSEDSWTPLEVRHDGDSWTPIVRDLRAVFSV